MFTKKKYKVRKEQRAARAQPPAERRVVARDDTLNIQIAAYYHFKAVNHIVISKKTQGVLLSYLLWITEGIF